MSFAINSISALRDRFRQLPFAGRIVVAATSVLLIAALLLTTVAFSTGKVGGKRELAVPLTTENARIVDKNGEEVILTGVNWFGFETDAYAPHGLWSRNYEDMLDQIRDSGFNTIRLPYSNELFESGNTPGKAIDYSLNPDLKGLSGLDLMDRIVEAATDRGLMVLLDRHRPTAEAQSALWYTPEVSEQRWISDWVMLAEHYRDNPLVIGADLHNEPRGEATWGDGNRATDWRLAAERAGNAILEVNPDWLIVVEGVETVDNDFYWWGGNLAAAKEAPVRLSHPEQLVYSAHDYGPGVWKQSWFSTPDFPENLPGMWHEKWAYLQEEGIAPVLLGEFGGRSVDPSDTEGVWQRKLFEFLKEREISYTYWSWNPNSGDTGGVLKDDWTTVDQAKLDLIRTHQAPQMEPTDDR
ncbi:MAG TPA: glycoside hydrolase family 5 protein [Natronosporangium sp.]|nr:glycoside hydrolase family 5 protein [Natronosporangium sp.]